MGEINEQVVKKRRFFQKKRIMFPLVIILAFAFLSIFGAFYSSSYIKSTKYLYAWYHLSFGLNWNNSFGKKT